MRIGFDLDNTIICYDAAFSSAAIDRHLLPPDAGVLRKEAVRDALELQGADGVRNWQTLQGHVYGAGINSAALFEGVISCLGALAQGGHELFIVSHKTQYGHFDAARTDLREAAHSFLQARGVNQYISAPQIFFCTTLGEKVEKVGTLRCEAFVDDLTDVLFHEQFPGSTRRILFRSSQEAACEQAASWAEVEQLLALPLSR